MTFSMRLLVRHNMTVFKTKFKQFWQHNRRSPKYATQIIHLLNLYRPRQVACLVRPT